MALLRSSLVLCFLVFYLRPSQQGPGLTRIYKRSTYNQVNQTGQPAAPNGYESFPDVGIFKFHPEAKNVLESMTICTQEGANLMIVNSYAEANVVKTLYAKYPDAWPWANIGFSDLNEDGLYETIFGDPLEDTGYEIWQIDEPDASRPSCGVIDRSGLLGGGDCNRERPFFCEYNKPKCT